MFGCLMRLALKDLRLWALAALLAAGALFVCNYQLPLPTPVTFRDEISENYRIRLQSSSRVGLPQELAEYEDRIIAAMKAALDAPDTATFAAHAADYYDLLLNDPSRYSGGVDEELALARNAALMRGYAAMSHPPEYATDTGMGALLVPTYALAMLPGMAALLPAVLSSVLVLDASSDSRLLGRAPVAPWRRLAARVGASWTCSLCCLAAALAPAALLNLARNGAGSFDYPVTVVVAHELRELSLGRCLAGSLLLWGLAALLVCSMACCLGTVSHRTMTGLTGGGAVAVICDLPSRLGSWASPNVLALLPTSYLRPADVLGYAGGWAIDSGSAAQLGLAEGCASLTVSCGLVSAIALLVVTIGSRRRGRALSSALTNPAARARHAMRGGAR